MRSGTRPVSFEAHDAPSARHFLNPALIPRHVGATQIKRERLFVRERRCYPEAEAAPEVEEGLAAGAAAETDALAEAEAGVESEMSVSVVATAAVAR